MRANRQLSSRLPLVLSMFVGAVFLIAAAMKAWNGYRFISVILYLLPEQLESFELARGLALGLIAWEATLGAVLLSGWIRGWSLSMLGITLLVFSGVLLYLLTRSDAPGCGCLGLFVAGKAAHADAWLGLLRNAGLLAILGVIASERRGVWAIGGASPGAKPTGAARAFTLVELLVSMCIIAVLIGLTLPSLGAAKYSAKQTRSLAMQRQLVGSVHAYAADFKESFPYMATPGQAVGGVSIRGFTIPVSAGCFSDQAWHWASVIVPDYLPCDRAAVELPEARQYLEYLGYPEHVIRSRYFISYNTFAGARYWEQDHSGDPADLHATGMRDVAFPSRKGLILDTAIGILANERGAGRTAYCAALVDGSARAFDDSSVNDENLVIPNYLPGRHPVLNTRRGLSGVDF